MPEFGACGPGFALQDAEVATMSQAYGAPRSAYFVIEQGGEVVGGAGVAPLSGGDFEVCELRKMYCLRAARGQGLGAMLLRHCLRLLYRSHALLRHGLQAIGEAPVFHTGRLTVDLVNRRVRLGETEIHLSPKEYSLLRHLVGHAGKVVTHHQLLTEVWGPAHVEDVQYLRVLMRQVRQKLEPDGTPSLLVTEPGVGYRLLLLPPPDA